jgi:hypothetical protein
LGSNLNKVEPGGRHWTFWLQALILLFLSDELLNTTQPNQSMPLPLRVSSCADINA